MQLEWTAGGVEPRSGSERPHPSEWVPVSDPSRPDGGPSGGAVAYRTELPAISAGDRAIVEIAGLNWGGRVWLDGVLVEQTATPFEPCRVTYAGTDSTELIVQCELPPDGIACHGTNQERTPSLRGPIDIHSFPSVGIVDLTVEPRPEEAPPALDATVTVDAERPVDDRMTVSVRPDTFRGPGTMERADVRVSPGERETIDVTVELPDAKLWWPHDLGRQPRYLVSARLGDHQRQCSTGLCSVRRERDRLYVNGEPYRARGIAIGPDTEPGIAIDRALDANATLLRAHAHVPANDLHRRCDEAGLLVWQDLPITGTTGVEAELCRSLAVSVGRRYGHHPSVACYSVLDDPASPFSDRLEDGTLGRARFRWRAWRTDVDRAAPERIAAAFPDGAVGMPIAGQPGTSPDAAHLYPGWNYGEPPILDWIADTYPGLLDAVGEFGAGSIADGAVNTPEHLDGRVLDAVSDPADPAQTRADQARIVGRTAEGIRRHGAAITVAYRLLDEAAAGGFGLCSEAGEPKPALESLRRAYEPVQAVLDGPPEGTAGVVVCNDEHRSHDCTVKWTAGSEAGSSTVSVEPLERADAGRIDIDDSTDRVLLELEVDGERTVRNRYAR